MSGATARAVDAATQAADYFDALSATLSGRGFEVHRMPILFDASSESALPEADYRNILPYPVLTYNNVLLEQRGADAVVYLPQYDLPTLDAAARRQWEALGYKVVPVTGYALSALYGGALRCSAKVLSRSDH